MWKNLVEAGAVWAMEAKAKELGVLGVGCCLVFEPGTERLNPAIIVIGNWIEDPHRLSVKKTEYIAAVVLRALEKLTESMPINDGAHTILVSQEGIKVVTAFYSEKASPREVRDISFAGHCEVTALLSVIGRFPPGYRW